MNYVAFRCLNQLLFVGGRKMAEFTVKQIAKQNQYDALYNDMLKEGYSHEDCYSECLEIFDDHDTSFVFMYKTMQEYEYKTKLDQRCTVIDNVCNNIDSFVNANFAIQGITSCLVDCSPLGCMSWKLISSRNLPKSVLVMMTSAVKSDDDEDNDSDHDEEEEEEGRILQIMTIFNFLLFLATKGNDKLNNIVDLFTFDEESIGMVCKVLDNDIGESGIITAGLEFLAIILSQPTNLSIFTNNSGGNVLDLIAKYYSKNDIIRSKANYLMKIVNNAATSV